MQRPTKGGLGTNRPTKRGTGTMATVITAGGEVFTSTVNKAARDTDGTSVSHNAGFTMSADYQSVNISCSITLPTTVNNVQIAMLEASGFIDDELANRATKVRSLLRALIKERNAG